MHLGTMESSVRSVFSGVTELSFWAVAVASAVWPAPLKKAGFGIKEAFTVFLSPAEKARVQEVLRAIDRDAARALVRAVVEVKGSEFKG